MPMPMSGQTWLGAAAEFVGMWVVMMAAMMLPSLAPVLWRYRQAWRGTGRLRLPLLMALVVAGYLLVWGALGIGMHPICATTSTLEMSRSSPARAIPVLQGVVLLAAGSLQFTSWHAHHLACWRIAPVRGVAPPPGPLTAWRSGVRLGMHCVVSSAGAMAALLAIGLMDLRAMAIVTAAITAERLAPAGERVARLLGALAVGAGLLVILTAPAGNPARHRHGTAASPDRHILTINR